MTHLLFLYNDVSFAHQLDIPFICWFCTVIDFSITAQIPSIHDLDSQIWDTLKAVCPNRNSFSTTKLSVAHLLPSLLRFTTCPICYWGAFFTSAHFVLNVISGHRLSLCHLVKHYKTSRFKFTNCSITH